MRKYPKSHVNVSKSLRNTKVDPVFFFVLFFVKKKKKGLKDNHMLDE